MDAPAVIYALRWLIHDTFRQTISSRVFWILLGVSGLFIIFCFGVAVEGGAVREGNEFFGPDDKPLVGGRATGRMTLLFGAFPVPMARDAEEPVRFIRSVIASWMGGVFGVLIALIFTAGFVPEALHPSAASVLLAKPVPRWLFLLGKFLGIVCFVGVQAFVFFFGTWLALGLRTGLWELDYLLGVPILVFHFALIYSVSLMLASLTRSTMACVVGSVLFWIVCFAVNYGRHFAVVYHDLTPGGEPLPAFTVLLAELGYWLLPKPIDLLIVMQHALNLGSVTGTIEEASPFKTMIEKDHFHPVAGMIMSCLFPGFALWASASQLSKTDY